MATVKTIKDVDENTWAEFKSLAAKNNMKAGEFFERLVEEYKRKADAAWEKILNPGKIISDDEAAYMEKLVKSLRKERGFRD